MTNGKKQNKFMKRSKDPPYKTVPARNLFVKNIRLDPNYYEIRRNIKKKGH